MADKILKTRLQLKYDTLSAWSLIENSFVPYAGEVCVVSVPQGQDELSLQEKQPAILFKVGDGKTTFKQLPWTSGLAADVFGWAKESSLTVTKNGTGNVVASISWDAALNDGKGGIKYETAAVATAEGLDQIQKDLVALTNIVNAMYTNTQIDEAIAAAKSGAETTAANALSAARTEISAEIDADVKVVADDLAGYKTTTNEALADRYTKGEADAKFALITDAYDDTELAGRVSTLETNSATKAELNNVDAKFAGYNTTAVQKGIDDAQDARIKAIEDTYLDAEDIANFETKENVKKVADDLAGYIESNDEALAGVKDTADKAAVKTEVESALALKADKSVVEAMYTNETIDSKISTAKEEAVSAAKTELDAITLAIEEYNDVESIVIKDSKGAVIADVSAATFVKDGMLADAQYNTDTNKIVLTWNTDSGKTTTTELDLNDLVDVYTGGTGINVSTSGEISIDDNVVVTHNDLNDTVNTLVGTIDDTADTASITGAKKYAEAQVAAEASARDAAIATAKSEAISAAATDATTKANTAETNAKTYADGLAVNYATAAQGTLADTALQEVTAAVDGGLKVTNKNEIAIDDSVTFVLYGGSASELIENAPTTTE